MSSHRGNQGSFALVAAIIFAGQNLFFSVWTSSGPDLHAALGVGGWLKLSRHGSLWFIDHVDATTGVSEICLALLLTWLLSQALRFIRGDHQPSQPKPLSS